MRPNDCREGILDQLQLCLGCRVDALLSATDIKGGAVTAVAVGDQFPASVRAASRASGPGGSHCIIRYLRLQVSF